MWGADKRSVALSSLTWYTHPEIFVIIHIYWLPTSMKAPQVLLWGNITRKSFTNTQPCMMRTNLNVNYMDWLKSLRPSCTTAVNTKSTQPYQLWLSGHLIRFPELCTLSIQYQMLRNGGKALRKGPGAQNLADLISGVEGQHDLDPNTCHLFSQEGLLSPQKPPQIIPFVYSCLLHRIWI